jgi:hypothetical protein
MFNFLAVYIFPDNQVIRQKMIDIEMQRMGVPPPTYVPTSNYPPSEQPVASHQAEQPITEPELINHK